MTKTTASPLSLWNSILTIDLTNYSTTILNTTLYPKIFTASSPLSLNTTTNTLSIDLTAYSRTTASDLRYQKLLTASTPLSLFNNTLSIDLSNYPTTTNLTSYYNPNNFVVGSGLLLSLKSSGVVGNTN